MMSWQNYSKIRKCLKIELNTWNRPVRTGHSFSRQGQTSTCRSLRWTSLSQVCSLRLPWTKNSMMTMSLCDVSPMMSKWWLLNLRRSSLCLSSSTKQTRMEPCRRREGWSSRTIRSRWSENQEELLQAVTYQWVSLPKTMMPRVEKDIKSTR